MRDCIYIYNHIIIYIYIYIHMYIYIYIYNDAVILRKDDDNDYVWHFLEYIHAGKYECDIHAIHGTELRGSLGT